MSAPPIERTQPIHARLLGALLDAARGGPTFLFLAYMLGNAIAYAYQMLMSRVLPPAEYGGLAALTSVYYVLAVTVKAIQAWIISATAGTGGERPAHPRLVLIGAMRIVLPVSALVFSVHWFGSGDIASFLRIEQPAAVKVLGLYVCTEFLEATVIGLSIGLRRPRLAGLVVIVEPIAKVIGGLGLVLLGAGIAGAMAGFPIGNFAGYFLGLAVLWPLLRRRRQPDDVEQRLPQPIDRYALVALLVNVGLMLVINVDQVVVKHYFPADIAGNYAVAWVLGRVIAITTISFGWVIFASSASLATDDPKRAWVLARALLAIGGISVLVTTAFFAAPTEIVRLMTGSSYPLASQYIGLIGIEMTLFALVYVQAYYHLSVRKLRVAWLLGGAGALEIGLLATYHNSIEQVLLVLILVMAALLVAVSAMSVSMFRRPTDPRPAHSPRLATPTTSELT